jgi:hypothetical protein
MSIKEVNKYIIAIAVTLIVGIGIGIGGSVAFYHYNPNIEEKITVVTLEGDKDVIKHKNIKTKGKNIEITTESEGKGKIKTIIPKNLVCKEYKNILSLTVNPFYQEKSFYLGYNLEYQRVLFKRLILHTGANINHDLMKNKVVGGGLKLGLGIRF